MWKTSTKTPGTHKNNLINKRDVNIGVLMWGTKLDSYLPHKQKLTITLTCKTRDHKPSRK